MRKEFPDNNIIVSSIIEIAILIAFLLVSFFYINPRVEVPKQSLLRASSLAKKITKDGRKERIDYVNKEGIITIAADLGYATKIITYMDKATIEEYYDDAGKPTKLKLGYYGVLREYDDYERNYRITYLDEKGNLTICSEGYSREERDFDHDNRVISVRYYDNKGNPTNTRQNGFGYLNEFDKNGNICKIVYVDQFGNAFITGQGFAILTRSYYQTNDYNDGRIEYEFYYDKEGKPICLSLGQYGVHRTEYNQYGQNTSITYVDECGKPIITTKGYTTVLRTFNADNTVETCLYYDINGNPCSLPESQYGTKNKNGLLSYLDANGGELFSLKVLLDNKAYYIIIFALLIVLLSVIVPPKGLIALLSIYLIIILYFTLLFREKVSPGVTFDVLWSYRELLSNNKALSDVLKNIWLFVPLGAIFYSRYSPKKMFLLIMMLSIFIEGVQFFSKTGFCEVDDVISNCLGGFAGYRMAKQLCELKAVCVKDSLH